MKRFVILLAILASVLADAGAQTIYLKKGDSMKAQGVKRVGDSISYETAVGGSGGTATLTLPISAIDHVVFSDSDTVDKVADLLFQGKNDQALGALKAFLVEQETYKGIKGNLWGDAAILKAKALVRTGQFDLALPLAEEILTSGSDHDVLLEARLIKTRCSSEKDDPKVALASYASIIKDAINPDTLADAWYYKGLIYGKLKDHRNAVLALLHVSAFYATSPITPSAMYWAAIELEGLSDYDSTAYYLDSLINQFPSAAETEKAKVELRRVQNIIKSTPKST